MSGTVASVLLLLLFALALLPLAVAYRATRVTVPAMLFSAAIVTFVLFYHANPFAAPLRVQEVRSAIGTQSDPVSECANVIDAVQEAGLLLDRTNPSRPVVRQAMWSRLPIEARQAIEVCLETSRPAPARRTSMTIVER